MSNSSDRESDSLRLVGEEGVIALFASLGVPPGPEVVVPNGDDAAAVRPDGQALVVVSTDTMVEEVHFSWRHASPVEVGRKLVSVNLSDLAAMGAEPRYMLLSLVIPHETPMDRLRQLAEGVHRQSAAYELSVIGGNVSQGPGPMALTATVWGAVEEAHIVRRCGAVEGDAIYVTGYLGDAKAGLHRMLEARGSSAGSDELRQALLSPVPRVHAGRLFGRSGKVRAMCDVSDGLGQDLRYLLAPGGLGAEIWGDKVPLSEACRRYCSENRLDPLVFAVEGGEDYELLFSAPEGAFAQLSELGAQAETPVHRIGRVLGASEFWLRALDGNSTELPRGYTHF